MLAINASRVGGDPDGDCGVYLFGTSEGRSIHTLQDATPVWTLELAGCLACATGSQPQVRQGARS